MPRSRRALWAPSAAVVALSMSMSVGLASGAFAAADDGEYVVVYQATATSVDTGPDGVANVQPVQTGAIRLVCSETECLVTEAPGAYKITEMPFDPRVGMASRDFPGKDDACLRDEPSPASASLIASASSFAATVDQPAVGWDDCGGGDRIYVHAYTTTWQGTDASGDVCVFSPEGCAPAPTPTPTPGQTAVIVADALADPRPASLGASELDTGSPAAPSVLSTLATPATAGTAPGQLLLAAVLTVVLVLLVAFPTSLLNSAAEAGSDRLSRWWSRRRTRRDPSTDAEGAEGASEVAAGSGGRGWTRTWWWAGAGVLAASVISSFVDPEFGFNAGSARVVLSILVSFGVDVVIGWLIVIWLVRRVAPGATHEYVFQPLTLLVVVAAVLFTRLTGFEPGIVFGLVAGVAFGSLAGRGREAKAALTTLGYAFGVAVVAWAGYGMLGGGASAGDSFGQTFAIETLASIAIGGMAALPIALFPVRGLPGSTLWAWSRRVWVACYAVGLFAFFIVLMPMPFSWEGVGWELWAWIGVYLAYAAFAAGAWLLLTRPWDKGEAASPASPDDDRVAEREVADRLDG